MEKLTFNKIEGLDKLKLTTQHFFTKEINAIDCVKLCISKSFFEGIKSFFPKEEKTIKIEADIKKDEIIFGVEIQNVDIKTDEVIKFEKNFLAEIVKSLNFTILFTAEASYEIIMEEFKNSNEEKENRIKKVFEKVGRKLFENDYEKVKERRFPEKKLEYVLEIESII